MDDRQTKEQKDATGPSAARRATGPNLWILLIVLALMAGVLLTGNFSNPGFSMSIYSTIPVA